MTAHPVAKAKSPAALRRNLRIRLTAGVLLDRIAQVQDALLQPPPPPDDRDPRQRAAIRRANDLLALWRSCRRAGCGRARRCLGQPAGCLIRHAAALPPDLIAAAPRPRPRPRRLIDRARGRTANRIPLRQPMP